MTIYAHNIRILHVDGIVLTMLTPCVLQGVREGRLTSLPITILTVQSVGACAVACLDETKTTCLGINYDSAGSNTCELLADVEGPGVYLRKVGKHIFLSLV